MIVSYSFITQADTLTEIISLGGSIRDEMEAGSLARTGAQILRQVDLDLELDKYIQKIFQARRPLPRGSGTASGVKNNVEKI